jgi:diguanylate cyclase (GGDEF)-like protein
MKGFELEVLLVEDNPGDARIVREALASSTRIPFQIEWVDRLGAGLERLAERAYHALVLDLTLPDGRGLEAFSRVRARFPDLAVVVLTGMDDETLGARAVEQGAMDYIVKDDVIPDRLPRLLRYAIERQQIRTELKDLDMLDPVTGLYNRRGFVALATPVLKVARRMKTGLLLVIAVLEGLSKRPPAEGRLEVRAAGNLLRDTFRDSDLTARVGSSEFAVLAVNATDRETLSRRLRERLTDFNSLKERVGMHLTVGVGVWSIDPEARPDISHWLATSKVTRPG